METDSMGGSESGNGGVLVGFVLGVLAGAGIALLWAPAAGRDTRQFLSEKSREGRDRAAELGRRATDLVSRQRETIKTAVERGREAYQEARQSSAKEPV
jgi:gas vesicle protein